MRVKRYVAESIQEAIARVKNDLGRNAIILHTKPFKEGGFFGFFAQRRFEVIAAVDENMTEGSLAKAEPKPTPAPPAPLSIPENGLEKPALTQTPQTVKTADNLSEPALKSLHAEISEMKTMLRQVAVNRTIAAPNNSGLISFNELYQSLKGLYLEDEVIDYLLLQVSSTFNNRKDAPLSELLNFCHDVLAGKILCSEPIKDEQLGEPQIVALIGPTGVGKTTTIAKLGANFNLFSGKKVGLITIDTYRIAAVEHLKTYGDIINLPVEVVYTPADLDQAIYRLKECDLILIDTAGRSPHNQGMLAELEKFLAHPSIKLIFLVISATTRYQDMISIVENFDRISYTHLLFTKLDETGSLGPIVSLALKTQRPMAYFTTGQNVPDDIEAANIEKLLSQLLKGLPYG